MNAATPGMAQAGSVRTTRTGTGYTKCHRITHTRFLPEVVQAAAARSAALKEECDRMVPKTLVPVEHIWMKGLSPKEAKEWSRAYGNRDNQ